MFDILQMAPPDAILGLSEAFRKDPNPEKINLSVGVYKDAGGSTPTLACVKEAERRMLEADATKAYLPSDGAAEFAGRIQQLLFGPSHDIISTAPAATAHSIILTILS